MREIVARAAAVKHLAVYRPDGAFVDAIVLREDRAPEPRWLDAVPPAYLQSPPREGAWTAAEFGPWGVTLRHALPVFVTAPDASGVEREALRLWVVATLDPRWVDSAVAGISEDRYRRADRVLVVDERFRLLSRGPDGASVGDSLAGRDLFGAIAIPARAFERRFAASGSFAAREPMVGTVQSMPSRRWAVLVRRPQAEAYGAYLAARRALGLGLAVLAVLATVIGVWLAARTVRPIAALVALTGRYRARDFSARSVVRTGDELESLGAAMEGMADGLAASEAEIARRQKVETDLARYLPREVAESVARGETALSLGGARRTVTVLFADVAGFTPFAEAAPPERVVEFLNELFTVLTEVVFRHGGMVDKFLGDAVMAVFGAGSVAETPAEQCARALACAEDMHRFVEASAPQWAQAYGLDVRLGIGVNVGEALVGNLGSETRMEYTVIGDVVNVAARLETLARAGQTLVTGAVAAGAGGAFATNPLGSHPLRGKREAVEIFEVMP
ncbi:MAG: adenylate/guanylate cyclase domain-containing protein [Polyangiales bacterium]